MVRLLLLALLAPLLGAPTEPPSDPVLATFVGGEVRTSAVEREIRFLRRDEVRYREHLGFSPRANWENWIQRDALRAMARVTAIAEGLTDDPEIRELARRHSRDWLLGLWAESCYGFELSIPDEAALAAEVAEEARVVPARVRVSHLFLRTRSEEEDRQAEAALRTWRGEISDADVFADYARRHSQSQTATRGGRMGYVRRGTLAPEIESILFALPVGAVSEPLHLRGGWHLFLIHENLPERLVPPRQKIKQARARYVAEAKEACRQRRLAQASVSSDTLGEGPILELRVGDWKVPGAIVRKIHGSDDEAFDQTVNRYLEDETLYQVAPQTGWVDSAMRLHLEDLTNDVLLGVIMLRQIDEFLPEPSEGELRAYAASRERPLHLRKQMRLGLLRMPIPAAGDPIAFLEDLEDLSRRLAAGDIDLPTATEEVPAATSQELPLLDIRELAGGRLEPLVFEAIKELPEGGVSAPIQQGREFVIIVVREIVPGRDRTFDEARDDLRRLWQNERRKELRESIAASVLERFDFALTAAGKETLERLDSRVQSPTEMPQGEHSGSPR